jgi:bacillithiol system protein YtxJ
MTVKGQPLIRQVSEALNPRSEDRSVPDATFAAVPDLHVLETLFEQSFAGPVVLFLNDPYCPISAHAHRRLASAGGEIHIIDVSRQHDINRAVAMRTGIRHESPQAFVLCDGTPIWNASHGDISAERLVNARDGGISG